MKNLSYSFAIIFLTLGLCSAVKAESPVKKVGKTVEKVGQAAKNTALAAKDKVEDVAGAEVARVGEKALKHAGQDAVEGAKETVKEGGQKVGGMFVNALVYLKNTLAAYTPEPIVQYLQEHEQAQTALVLVGGAGLCWFLYNYGGTIANKVGQTADYILDTIKTHKKKVLAVTLLAVLWYANQNGYFSQEVVAEGAEKAGELVEGVKELGHTVADKASDTASQVKEGAKQLIEGAKDVGQKVVDKAAGAASQVKEGAQQLAHDATTPKHLEIPESADAIKAEIDRLSETLVQKAKGPHREVA